MTNSTEPTTIDAATSNKKNMLGFFLIGLIIAVVVAVVALGQTDDHDDSDNTSGDNSGAPITAYANPDILVDTAWIQENAGTDGVFLLDIGGQDDYNEGHLPNAYLVSLNDFANPDDPIRGQIATAEQVADTLGSLGIQADDTVVFYDRSNNLLAARAYWVLKYYQHEDVRLYNGGVRRWEADGNALSTDTPDEPIAVAYTIADADPAIRTTWEYVIEHTDDPSTLVCDTRSAEEYIGTDVRADRGGHIPGAINLEWSTTVNTADGTFKSAEALDALVRTAGFTPDKSIITYCQTGVRGAHTWFVLRELLGYPDVRNYDGSWEEYGNNAESQIET